MKHDVQTDELLSAYLAGDVTPEERVAIELRLAESPELKAQLEDLKSLVAMLRQAQRPVTADMLADIKRRIEAHIGAPISRAVLAQLLSASISGDMTEAERRALDVYLANSPAARAQASSLRELSLFLKKAERHPSANATRRLAERLSAKLPAAALAPVLPVKAPEKSPAKAESVRVHAHANPSNVRIFIAQESPWPRRVFKITAAVAAAIALSAGAIFGLHALSRPSNAGNEMANLGPNQDNRPNDPKIRQTPSDNGNGAQTPVDGAKTPQLNPTATSTDAGTTAAIIPPKPVDGSMNSPPNVAPPVDVVDDASGNAARATHTTTPKQKNTPADLTQPGPVDKTPDVMQPDPKTGPDETPIQQRVVNGVGGVAPPLTGPSTQVNPNLTQAAINTSTSTSTSTGTGTGSSLVQGSPPPTSTNTGKSTSTSTSTSPISSQPTIAMTQAPVQTVMPPKDGMLAYIVYGTPQAAGVTIQNQQKVASNSQIITDGTSRIAFILPGNGRLWVNHNTSITVLLSNMNTTVTLVYGEIGYRAPQSGNLTVNHASGVQIATVNGLTDINNDPAANTIVTSVVEKSATVVHKDNKRTSVRAGTQVTIDLGTDIAAPAVSIVNIDPGQWHVDMLIPGDQPNGSPITIFNGPQDKKDKKRSAK